jgi:hypothetical protein
MKHLRRWSEEGATFTEMSLVEASQCEPAPNEVYSRTLKTLGLPSVVALTAVAATPTVVSQTGVATKTGLTLLAKVLTISLVGGIVGGGLLITKSRHTDVSSRAKVVASRVAVRPLAVPPNVVAPVPPVPSAAAPSPVQAPGRSTHSASAEDRLPQELKALELAHRALTMHDPNTALQILDRYRGTFPHGNLASDEMMLRVQALVASGNRAEAQAFADSYSIAHPNSPYSQWLEKLVHSEQ